MLHKVLLSFCVVLTASAANAVVTSFTGSQSASYVDTTGSTQTKSGGLSILGNVRIHQSTGNPNVYFIVKGDIQVGRITASSTNIDRFSLFESTAKGDTFIGRQVHVSTIVAGVHASTGMDPYVYILDVRRIEFADGTIQVSAPSAGVGAGLYSFMDSDTGIFISSMNFLSVEFTRTTASSSATFKLNPGSATLQGNVYDIRLMALTADNTNYATTESTHTLQLTASNTNYVRNDFLPDGSTFYSSSGTISGNLNVSGDLTFHTTWFLAFGFPFAVGNATNAVVNATDTFNGLALLDGLSSTSGLNSAFYKIFIPDTFVTGSTPVFKTLISGVTGFVNAAESYVISYATGSSHSLAIATGTAPSLYFTSSTVVAVTGNTSIQGGERVSVVNKVMNGVGVMLGSGNKNLYVRVVRDGLGANDTSNSRSAVTQFVIAAKFSQ